MAVLTKTQMKAIQAYAAERDAAIEGIAEVFREAGLDPAKNYTVNGVTGEATEAVFEGVADGRQPEDNSRVGRRRARS